MQGFVITLLTCSATMSALGLVYMALTPLLTKRYSEKGLYYAWLIIVIGLIIPFRPHFSDAIVTVDIPSKAVSTITRTGSPVSIAMPTEATALPAAVPSFSAWQIAVAVWLAGIIVFITYHAVKHYRFSRLVARWNEPVTNEQTLNLLQDLKAEMGILRQVELYSCLSIGSPALLGFMRPRILLPQTDFAPEELKFILKHELTHYKRKDLYYKVLVLIATAIHWFNPAVYLIAKAVDAACELSCDADTVRGADTEMRQRYSETIIGVIRFQSKLKTALSTNFYGGKRGMKNRISSIMNTNRRKTGTAIICCTLILTMGTGIAFAAQTMPTSRPSVGIEENDKQLNTTQIVEDTLMSYVDSTTGKIMYSWDDGKTWTDQNNTAYAAPVVEWWTYDEYKVWADEQIASLQALADDGVPDYYDKDDVLRDFTQADVDEFATNCNEVLNSIKNGALVSKTVDGFTGTVISYDPRDIATVYEGGNAVDVSYAAGGNSWSNDYVEQNYDDYAQFGITYRDKKLYYKGEPVRCFDDWYSLGEEMMAGRSYFDKDGTVDVFAERDFSNIIHNPDGSHDPSGKLIGVKSFSQAEFDERNIDALLNPQPSVAQSTSVVSAITLDDPPDVTEWVRESIRLYEPLGVSFDKKTGTITYKGLPVREIYDHKLATLITLSAGTGFANGAIPPNAIDLRAVYEGNVLKGLKKSTQEEFDARTLERQSVSVTYSSTVSDESSHIATNNTYTINASSDGISKGSGRTLSEIFEDYAAFGITFNTKSVNGGLGNIYYNGELVRKFTDIAPDGGVFSCSSSDGGIISLRTVYDENGKLIDLEVIGSQE